jgi:hypothetical protein
VKVRLTYRRLLTWSVFTALALSIVYRSLSYSLCADEIEHVHASWKVLQGERVYVDFFEHHHPLLYFVLAPLIEACGEHSSTLLVCRLAMLPFVAGVVLITFVLSRRAFGPRTAMLAALLLMATPSFVAKAIEVRPDVPQTFFGLLALLLLCPRKGRPSWLACGAAGVCLGIAFLFLQKAVFFAAALGAVMLWRVARRQMGMAGVLALAAGALLPLIPFAWWLTCRNDLAQYFLVNWTLNAHFIGGPGLPNVVKNLTKVLLFEPGICLLTVLALTRLPRSAKRRELMFLAVGTGLLLFFGRSPQLQSWLALFPLLAILAAAAFVRMRGLRSRRALALLAGCVLLPGLIGSVTLDPNRAFLHKYTYRKLGDQLREIDYVLAITGPEDRVYDASAQFNLFRHDVDYFWFSIAPDEALAAYRSLRPVEFELYGIIARTQPKVVSTFLISKEDPRIKNRYRVSQSFADLLIRRDTPAR